MAPGRSPSTQSGNATNASILLLVQLTSSQSWSSQGLRGSLALAQSPASPGHDPDHPRRRAGDAASPPPRADRPPPPPGKGGDRSQGNRPRKLTYAVTRAPRAPGVGTTTAGSPSARLTPRKRPSPGSHLRKTRGPTERRSRGSLRWEPGEAQGSQAPLREVAPPLRAAGPTSARAPGLFTADPCGT